MVNKKLLNPVQLAPPTGFSHGILVPSGRLLILAGQTASGSDGHIVSPGNIVRQFEQVIANLQTVCQEAGGALTHIVKLTIYVTDKAAYREHQREIGQVYRRYFGKYYPAMTLVEVKGLWDEEAMIEIEGIAVVV